MRIIPLPLAAMWREHRFGQWLMIATLPVAIAASESTASAGQQESHHDVLVIVGAAGAPEFAEGFVAAGEAWKRAGEQAGVNCTIVGLTPDETAENAAAANASSTDRDRVQRWLETTPPDSALPAWVVYIGHGTFDGQEVRLNLRGADVTGTELQQWLRRFSRPLVVVHGGSASGPLVPLLSGRGRVIITATQSGDEVNYARFGERFADVVASPRADIDQDGQTTVLEAFLTAAQDAQLFYEEAGRMASEHALIDDNGDKRGTPPDWFRGTRATKRAEDGAAVDGVNAHRIALVENAAERALTDEQRAERERLEQELEKLRERKATLAERDYWRELELILRQLSAIYIPPPAESTTDAPLEPAPENETPAATAPEIGTPATSPPDS